MTASSEDIKAPDCGGGKPLGRVDLVGLDRADDLAPGVLAILREAELIAGPPRWMSELEGFPARKLELTGGLDPWLRELERESRTRPCVALASGDPNFYGLAKRLMAVVPPERTFIHPSTTTVQKAFARLKTTWAGAEVESLHGRDGWRALYSAVFRAGRAHSAGSVAVYTDPANSPDLVARRLIGRGCAGAWTMAVFENLDSPGEKASELSLEEAAGGAFAPLNLVVLRRAKPFRPLTLGAPEGAYEHEQGLITKSEIRAAALGAMRLEGAETFWDIGCGSGSVSLEAGLLLPRGAVWAVEREPGRALQAGRNRAAYGCAHVEILQGEALDLIPGLPDPDRVFIGGSGKDLEEVAAAARKRLSPGGVITASVVTHASLGGAVRALSGPSGPPAVLQLSCARSRELSGSFYFTPLNQVYLVTASF
ncbi:MAG: precorrin-6y C5,15-methyltransferase (decarboxylating) subunit CbiE [Deltaproteobacteria bacterium]|jgi:precorrin-6Y C5,15-methyltransferase (decarboxylating)|nr:precorrin-6y C5,15-methyltransferase (decarboxylating) subunit CbiE [Deltaproteobacteria bacterium]